MAKNKSGFLYLGVTFFVLLILYSQSLIPLWKGHLEIDIWDFYETTNVYLSNGSFKTLKGNEIMPGGLLFFFLPLIFSSSINNYHTYLGSFILVNLFILALLFLLYKRFGNVFACPIMALILLGLGPILLFRFDLIVCLLVILSIISFKKGQYFLSTLFLGLATGTKLYPIIFLPYYLLVIFLPKYDFKKAFFALTAFLLGFSLPILGFVLLGGSLQKFIYSLTFHSRKPMSVESLWGTIYTGLNLLLFKKPPALFGEYGLWALKPKIFNQSTNFLNWLSLLPVIVLYIYLLLKRQKLKKFRVSTLFLLTLSSLTMAKNLHPQYLIWPLSLFPFLHFKPRNQTSYLMLAAVIFIITLLTQYIYPLSYTSFIQTFYGRGLEKEIFYLLVIRNILLVLLLYKSIYYIIVKKTLS